jgi:hypothetical protein
MKPEPDWATAVRKIAELITPSGSHWPGNWRTCLASSGQPTCSLVCDSHPNQGLIIALVETGGGTGPPDELARLLVKVGLSSRSWQHPSDALGWLNRSLLQLEFEVPVIGLTLVSLDPVTGRGQLARAGLPPAVLLQPGESPNVLVSPAPFLGVVELSFSDVEFVLLPGGRILLSSAGRPDQLAAISQRREDLIGQAYVEAITKDLVAQTEQPDGVLVVVLEQLAALRLAG